MEQSTLDIVRIIGNVFQFGSVANPDISRCINNKKVTGHQNDEIKQIPTVTEGQQFTISASKSEHFTSPPKAFTEDTLLSAMEHAGQENYDENSEKKGLGTPATRAGTIEGLVKKGYAERKGKQIVATEKGVNLINVVPDEVKSAQLTSDWEMKLQQIENGEYSADRFMAEIEDFIRTLCEKYGSADSSVSFGNNAPIGKCPKCEGEIVKGKFGYYCKNKCGMNVSKVYGKELSEKQIIGLLEVKNEDDAKMLYAELDGYWTKGNVLLGLNEVARNAGISLDTLNNLNYDTQQELVFEYMADSSDTARLYEITNKALSIAELDRVAKLINIPVDTLKEYPFETQVQLCGIYAMESDNVTEFELANRLRGAVGL